MIIDQLLGGKVFLSDMPNEMTTLLDGTITYNGKKNRPKFNNAKGLELDVEVSNAVIHFVDAVVQGGSPTPPTPTPPTPTPPTPTPPTPTPPTPTPPTPTPPTPTPPIEQNIMEYLRTVPDADYMVTAIEIGWLDDDFSDVGDFEGPWSKY